MIDIYIVHDNPKIEDIIWNIPLEMEQPFIHFLDIGSLKDKSKAFKLKQDWGAKKNPFCLLEKDGKIEKAFYSETGVDAISQVIKYLKKDEK